MKRYFSFYHRKNDFLHNNIVQQHFVHKCSFQRVPNQVEKLRKFKGVGGGMMSTPRMEIVGGGGSKAKVSSVGGGGGYGYFLEPHNIIFVLAHA